MNDYPLPRYAVAVWFDGSGLSVRIPPAPGADKGHIITLPDDENGRAILSSILRERATDKLHRIGTPGAPTQAQLSDWGKQFQATKLIKEQRNATQRTEGKKHVTSLSLEDLGLL